MRKIILFFFIVLLINSYLLDVCYSAAPVPFDDINAEQTQWLNKREKDTRFYLGLNLFGLGLVFEDSPFGVEQDEDEKRLDNCLTLLLEGLGVLIMIKSQTQKIKPVSYKENDKEYLEEHPFYDRDIKGAKFFLLMALLHLTSVNSSNELTSDEKTYYNNRTMPLLIGSILFRRNQKKAKKFEEIFPKYANYDIEFGYDYIGVRVTRRF